MDLPDDLDKALPTNHLVPAVRAELLCRLGRRAEAVAAFGAALVLVRTGTERAHLQRHRADLNALPE